MSNPPQESTNRHQTEIQAALDSTESEYVQSLLSDLILTDEEYSDAKGRFLSCLAQEGATARIDNNSFFVSKGDKGGGINGGGVFSIEGIGDECYADFTPIHSLYTQMKNNPEGGDQAESVTSCLTKEGLVPEEYSRWDYELERDENSGFVKKLRESEGEDSRKYLQCVNNPLGAE